MNLKVLILLIFSHQMAAAEPTIFSTKSCSKEFVAIAIKELADMQTMGQNVSPPDKTYVWLDTEISKIQPSVDTGYPTVKEKVDADVGERINNVTIEFTQQYQEFKKQIIETPVAAPMRGLLNRFIASYSGAAAQVYIPEPREKENPEKFLIRNAVGFSTHRLFMQKTTAMVSDLIKKVGGIHLVSISLIKSLIHLVSISLKNYRHGK